MKRIFSAIVFIVIILNTTAVLCVKAQEGKLSENITWHLEGDVLTVSGTGAIPDMDLNSDEWKAICRAAQTIIIDEGITEVGAYAFYYSFCQTLKLPESLEKIGEYAFYYSLQKNPRGVWGDIETRPEWMLKLPENIKCIGDHAFENGIIDDYEWEIPKNLEYLGDYAFGELWNNDLNVPKNLKYFGKAAFSSNAPYLGMITVDEENEYYAAVDGVLYSKDKTVLVMYPVQRKGESYTVLPGTKEIREGAFGRNNLIIMGLIRFGELKRLIIPEDVEKIETHAFVSCVLDLLELPCSLEIVEENAFDRMPSSVRTNSTVGVKEIDFAGSRGDWVNFRNMETLETYRDWESSEEAFFLGPLASTLISYGEISVKVNEKYLETDVYPIIRNERTLIPMRAIFEALGAEVSWDNEARCAIAVKGDTEVKITIGETALYKNGEKIALDTKAELVNDRTMVPVRAIAEAFGASVTWDNETKSAIIAGD